MEKKAAQSKSHQSLDDENLTQQLFVWEQSLNTFWFHSTELIFSGEYTETTALLAHGVDSSSPLIQLSGCCSTDTLFRTVL